MRNVPPNIWTLDPLLVVIWVALGSVTLLKEGQSLGMSSKVSNLHAAPNSHSLIFVYGSILSPLHPAATAMPPLCHHGFLSLWNWKPEKLFSKLLCLIAEDVYISHWTQKHCLAWVPPHEIGLKSSREWLVTHTLFVSLLSQNILQTGHHCRSQGL